MCRLVRPSVGARRLALAAALMAALAAPTAATLWAWTPSGDDVQARVEAIARARGTTVLRPDEVPSQLADAVIAIEDERFYQHHGIDSLGLGRAVLYDATNLCLCQGGSTVTEQLVKDVFLGGSDRGYNKLQDMVLALKVERVLTKKQIMADYLSEITSKPLLVVTWTGLTTTAVAGDGAGTGPLCGPPGVGVGAGLGIGA